MIKAGIIGGTGYAGQELIRLLYNHPEVEIKKIFSETHGGKNYSFVYRNFTGIKNDICSSIDFENITEGLDILFSSLPYGVLMKHLNENILDCVKVIDLGVDYRFMNKEKYKKYYGKEHESIELSKKFTYGLSEWNENEIRLAENIANPGCFASAIQLALLPLLKENIISSDLIVDGKCSLSGSGRTLTIGTHFIEANDSVKPYKIIDHPHKFEVKKGIEFFSGKKINLTFVPHIVPMQRGILVSCYTKLNAPTEYDFIKSIFKKYYHDRPFVKLLDKGMYVETKWTKNSNMCHINFEIDEENNSLIIFAAIDNLVKGAAGQAIQNLNIMYGFKEITALDFIPSFI